MIYLRVLVLASSFNPSFLMYVYNYFTRVQLVVSSKEFAMFEYRTALNWNVQTSTNLIHEGGVIRTLQDPLLDPSVLRIHSVPPQDNGRSIL